MVNNSGEIDTLEKLNLIRLDKAQIKNNLSISKVEPNTLINSRRFDIMAKYIYAKFYDMNLNSSWGSRLYEEHIWVFNNYDEDDGSGKKGIKSFFTSFHDTLDSMKENGFDDNISLLPIDENNVPIDGAHRLTAALLYNEKVKIIQIKGTTTNYNYEFFKHKGLLTKWGDAIAYEYCKLKKDVNIALFFPKALEGMEPVKNILQKFTTIYYEKDVELKEEGPRNLLLQLNRLKGFTIHVHDVDKILNCYFDNQNNVSVFLIETNSSENLANLNMELERLYNYGDYAPFYISRTYKETVRLSQTFFNDNSIHFLNNSKPINVEGLDKSINSYKEFLKEIDIDNESLCVTNNTVLSVYGLLESTNIEYIQKGLTNEEANRAEFDNLICCNNDFSRYGKSVDEIIFNPENHFYYEGIKFTSLKTIKKIKKYQQVNNNKEEIKIINGVLGKWPNNINYELLRYNLIKKSRIVKLKLIAIKLKFSVLLKKFVKLKH